MKGDGVLKIYVDKNALQDYTTKLIAKEKTIFATKNEVGSPLVASTVAEMTDHDKIYVYVGSETGYTAGNWYYWNGTAWTSGGVYNSEGFVLDDTLTSATLPAQAKAVGDKVSQLSEDINDYLLQNNVLYYSASASLTTGGGKYDSLVLYAYSGTIAVGDVFTFAADSVTGSKTASPLYIRAYNGSTLIRNVHTQLKSVFTVTQEDITAGIDKIEFAFYPTAGTALTETAVCSNPTVYRGTEIYQYAEQLDEHIVDVANIENLSEFVYENLAEDNLLWRADSYTIATGGGNYVSETLFEYTGQVSSGDVFTFSADSVTGATVNAPLYIRLYSGSTLIRNVNKGKKATCVITGEDITAGVDKISFVFYPASGTALTQNAVCTNPAVYTGYTLYPYSDKLTNFINNSIGKKQQSYTYTGTIATSETIDTGLSYSPKYGFIFGLSGNISTFDKITLQFDSTSPNQIIIDQTNVTLKSRFIEDSILPHGITISDAIQINIIADNPNTVKVTVGSKGVTNTVTGDFTITAYENIKVINGTSQITNTAITMGCGSINHGVWFIGDSYLNMMNDARWTYYVWQNEYTKNTLFCGATGAGADQTQAWINSLLTFGTPKAIVWCMGMNYNSDSGAPASNWLSDLNWLIGVCQENSIELILATIPTVPTRNNEYKNAYVRESGYRYIDFAKAVGANASGEWYAGMLASDEIHPTQLGAVALYHEAIASVPEIMYE